MPRIQTISKTVFSFAELSDSAKERAREWWRSCESSDFAGEFEFDDIAECASRIGIELKVKSVPLMGGGKRAEPVIYWSGFSSQGDGACFEGSYYYRKGAAKLIRQHAPKDTELHRIADELQHLQAGHFYSLSALMTHRGHYYHSGCMRVDVCSDRSDRNAENAEEALTQLMRDFANWIYRHLEAEYDYRMSDENVDESILANGYEFDESGRIA
jgi:hypothetical protein